jgi:hypothetical protein
MASRGRRALHRQPNIAKSRLHGADSAPYAAGLGQAAKG